MRELKVTTINNNIYLYPYPVIKENKYLIRCSTLENAQIMIDEVINNTITHPDKVDNRFVQVEIHTDGKTKILELIS